MPSKRSGNPFDVLRRPAKRREEPVKALPETVIGSTERNQIDAYIHKSEVIVIESEDSDLRLLCFKRMHLKRVLPFKGSILLAPVVGSVEMLGFEMKSQFEFRHCVSASTGALAGIRPVGMDSVSECLKNGTDGGCRREVGRMLALLDDEDVVTVVAVREFQSNVDALERLMPVFKSIVSTQQKHSKLFSLDCDQRDCVSIPSQWVDAAVWFDNASFATGKSMCVVGPRNIGKSTFSRYLVNRLLSGNHSEVVYIDCDPGQPGFTPAGIVSLHRIRDAVLTPCFMSLRQPYRAFCVGATSPKNDPDYYLACVAELVRVWRKELSHLPLVVNSSGWFKGMGLDLLHHILRSSSFSAVAYLNRIFHQNTADASDGFLTGCLSEASVLHRLPGTCDDYASKLKFTAADHRILSLCSYFLASKHISVTRQVPFRVKWNSVRIKFLLQDVPYRQSLFALNGAIVGLVVDQCSYNTHKQQTNNLQIIPSATASSPKDTHCVGFAIIRAIDAQASEFHIVTPVNAFILQQVNLIVRSPGLEMPVCLVTGDYEDTRTCLPYATYMAAEGYGALTKRNRHIQRRRLND